jgi:hypothetical protein
VVLVITDVSENMSPPSSGFLKVIGFHSCVNVESLLVNFSIEVYYVGSKNLEDGVDIFSETSVLTIEILCNTPEYIIATAVKTSQKTVFFNPTQSIH